MKHSLLFILMVLFFGCQKEKSQPNILFILSDDHAVKAISAYDSSLIRTPNIDKIARDGILFSQAFVTNSICAPARAAILTGKYSHLNGQIDNHAVFDSSQQTFPKLLQKAGYNTAFIGKWHLKSTPAGFDYWNIFRGQGYYYNPDMIVMGDTVQVSGYATDIVTDKALQWLEERRDASRPFFLFYSHKAPHRNWMPPLRYLDTLQSRIFPDPPAFWDTYETRLAAESQLMHLGKHFFTAYDSKINTTPLQSRDSILWNYVYEERLTPQEKETWQAAYADERREYIEGIKAGKPLQWLNYQRYLRDYLRCVMAVDDNIGRMIHYLDERGLADNTIVVYISDQGMYLGEHGWFDKRWMYEESFRFPFLMKFPGSIQAGQVRNEMVMNIDLAPTLLDYAGVPVPQDMQGSSIKTLLENKPGMTWRKDVYYHYYEYPFRTHVNPHYGIRNDRYKLIKFYGDVDGWEFFDLSEDPAEQNNAYNNPRYSGKIDSMKTRLKMLQDQYQDTEPERLPLINP